MVTISSRSGPTIIVIAQGAASALSACNATVHHTRQQLHDTLIRHDPCAPSIPLPRTIKPTAPPSRSRAMQSSLWVTACVYVAAAHGARSKSLEVRARNSSFNHRRSWLRMLALSQFPAILIRHACAAVRVLSVLHAFPMFSFALARQSITDPGCGASAQMCVFPSFFFVALFCFVLCALWLYKCCTCLICFQFG